MKHSETSCRQKIIRVMHTIIGQGFACANDGNISFRLDEDSLLVSPSGVYKRWMKAEDLLIVDMKGNLKKGKVGLKPTSEIFLHLEVYRQRSDVQAIIHAHPPYATALTVAGIPYPADILPEILVTLGEVPTAAFATPGTQAMADSIHDLINKHNALLLSHHGSLTVGKTLEEALIALERLEYGALVYYLACALGKHKPRSAIDNSH